MSKPKVANEMQMRRGILATARVWGCEKDILKIFDRYDRLLKNCTNPVERYQIGVMGAAEVHKFLGCRGALVVDGVEILPGDPALKVEE
jgi:hypothetical protein